MASKKANGSDILSWVTRNTWAKDEPSVYRVAANAGISRALDAAPSGLYRFLENELAPLPAYESYLTRVVRATAIWFSTRVYERTPVLLPHVIRDNTCRRLLCATPGHVKGRKGRTGEARDLWSTPTPQGYVRDDNSLIKMLPGSLSIDSAVPKLRGRRLGNGFVACHIWPMNEASDPWLNSFVPNLVWLPRPLDVFSDRRGHFVQRLLRIDSLRRFRRAATVAHREAEQLWRQLPGPSSRDQASPFARNEFVENPRWLRSRINKIATMTQLLSAISDGGAPNVRSRHSHYDLHVHELEPDKVHKLAKRLRQYAKQLAASQHDDAK